MYVLYACCVPACEHKGPQPLACEHVNMALAIASVRVRFTSAAGSEGKYRRIRSLTQQQYLSLSTSVHYFDEHGHHLPIAVELVDRQDGNCFLPYIHTYMYVYIHTYT